MVAALLGSAAPEAPAPQAVALDPVSLILHASGPVFVVVWLLVAASVLVWLIAALKLLQVRRLSEAERRFELVALRALEAEEMFALVDRHPDAPGARVVRELRRSAAQPRILGATARRAVVEEQKRLAALMPTLGSIGSASPFVGLFGTVYGIMDAFLRIGREKSASLPVVAPAIGEALIATAIGLFAAIPAVIFYNAIARRQEDLLAAVEASAEGWVALATATAAPSAPSVRPAGPAGPPPLPESAQRSDRPPPLPGG
ncbi:MAG: MotA/TolQ/ExbB proton channel family protein [Deltaproteobacteria bacterium]|nr:MotA/TolQ/ExbB proton channel family protein [Deltaproteobacteria bacterium]